MESGRVGAVAVPVTEQQAARRAPRLESDWYYRDDGCEVAPKCLECWLPKCRYDTPGGARMHHIAVRDAEIVRLHAIGTNPAEIAERFGVSKRTVFRVVAASS